MASNVWWCVISLTWFLAAGLKWGCESIAQYRAHFHLFAWTLPLVQTLAVLSQSLVDADPLTGICGVGNTQLAALRLYSLIPSSAYLLVGITFLGAGFIALFNIRRSLIHNQRNPTRRRRSQKLEKLMIRIGVFSILFTVPATCVIACQYYESLYRKEWERTIVCRASHSSSLLSDECAKHEPHKPEFWVFILKYFMSMVIGVTSGFWIWSSKSLNSWRVFFAKFCPSAAQSLPTPSKLTPNSSECCTEEIDRSICCLTIKDLFCCNNKEIRRKDSMVYFQARDDFIKPNLYDLPHSTVPVGVSAAPAFPQPQTQPYANFSDDDFAPVLLKSGSSSGQFYASNWANLVVSGVHNQQQQMQQQQQFHQHLAMASQGTIYEFPSSTKLPTSATTTTNLTSSTACSSSLPSTISTIRR